MAEVDLSSFPLHQHSKIPGHTLRSTGMNLNLPRERRIRTKQPLNPQSLPPRPPTPPPLPRRILTGTLSSTHTRQPISTPISQTSSPFKSDDGTVHTRIWSPEKPEVSGPRAPQSPPIPLPDAGIPPLRQSVPDTSVGPFRQEVLIGGDTVILLKEMVALRERDVARRIHVKNGLRDMKYKWGHAAKAQEDFMNASAAHMETVINRTAVTPTEQSLQEAWKQLQDMASVVKDREKWLETAQDDLLNLGNRLFMKETAFYDRFRGIARVPMFYDDTTTDDFTVISNSSASSTTTVSIAHRYYSRVGDLNLLRDKIFNFESDHRQQKLVRDTQRKEGLSLDPPDKVFYQKFFLEKEAMIREYVSAKQQMEEMRESCARADVDVQPPNIPPFLDHLHRIERPFGNYSGHPVEGELDLHILNAYGHTDNQHRVVRWIRDVQTASRVDTMKPSSKDVPNGTMGIETSPLLVSDVHGWTDQEAEDYLALPSYNNLLPSATSENSVAETDTPERIQKYRLATMPRGPKIFHGEPPSRRYSAPSLPPLPNFLVRLSTGTLEGKHKGNFEALFEPGLLIDSPKSLG